IHTQMSDSKPVTFVNIVGSSPPPTTSTTTSSISFSFGGGNNNGPLGLANKKRKEPETSSTTTSKDNFILSLEGTKITSSIPEQPAVAPKVIPLSQQRHINSNDDNNVVSNNIQTEQQDAQDEQDKNKRLKQEKDIEVDSDTSMPPSDVGHIVEKFNPKQHGLQVKEKRQSIKPVTGSGTNTAATQVRPLIDKLDGLENYKDENEKFKYDMNSRPDQADIDDYEETPIEVFGEAMLRGMGWAPGKGIGLSSKSDVEPIKFVKRAGYRLGLGAKPADVSDKDKKYLVAPTGEDGRVRHTIGLDTKLVSMKYGLDVGDKVLVVAGTHEGMYAIVNSIPNESKVVISFASEEKAVVDKSDLQIVEHGKATNATSSSKANGNGKSSSNGSNSGSSSSSSKQPIKTIVSNNDNDNEEETWLRSNIMVKIVSKSLGDGKYYNKKATVVDVTGERLCVLELDGGKVLENVKQRWLETAIPRDKGSSVIIVQGKYRGRLGTLIERSQSSSSKKEVAIIQMVGDLSVREFDLDDICQYVGSKDMEY
ncbi:hypothetical protein SAMD00019534_029640, partial [Acytostelium subglobosum LB1]|uniref:hypothetical protein n=1 Tax=Acytostelium subglobosum LB1 TaxID=1410327 RepID=UPI000644FD6A